ncbi:MAG: phosphoenolpyruvate-utilizing N-terminal domain-containing protein, partial [Candidatus Nanohaloarchaea archaeon]
MTETIDGIGVTPRAGRGTVSWYRSEVDIGDREAGSVTEEMDRFTAAKETAEEELREQKEDAVENIGTSEAEIFDAEIQFLNDPEIVGNVEDRIEEGMAAENAVKEGFEGPIEQLEGMEGLMAERGDDLGAVFICIPPFAHTTQETTAAERGIPFLVE